MHHPTSREDQAQPHLNHTYYTYNAHIQEHCKIKSLSLRPSRRSTTGIGRPFRSSSWGTCGRPQPTPSPASSCRGSRLSTSPTPLRSPSSWSIDRPICTPSWAPIYPTTPSPRRYITLRYIPRKVPASTNAQRRNC